MTTRNKISKKVAAGLVMSSLFMGSFSPIVYNAVFATEVSDEIVSLTTEEMRIAISDAVENYTSKLKEIVGDEKAHEIAKNYILFNFNDISNWDDDKIRSDYSRVVNEFKKQLFAIDLVNEVVTALNDFYERQGSEFHLAFEDIYRNQYNISFNDELISDGRYTLSLANTVIHPNLYGLSQLYDGNPNDMIRYQNRIIEAIKSKEINLEDIKEVRKAYNDVVTLFNSQPEEKRKEQFAEVDSRIRSINYGDNGHGFFADYVKEESLQRIRLLEHYIKGELADNSHKEATTERLLTKEKEMFAALNKLSFVEVIGDISPYYVVKEVPREELTFKELSSYEQTEEKRLETYQQRTEQINAILSKEHDLFEKYGLEHKEKFSINLGEELKEIVSESPISISVGTSEEYMVSKRSLRPLDFILRKYNVHGLIRYGEDGEVGQAIIDMINYLELADKIYQAENDFLTRYNSLVNQINQKPMPERKELGQKLLLGKLTYGHVFEWSTLTPSYRDIKTEKEVTDKKEALLAELDQFEKEFLSNKGTSADEENQEESSPKKTDNSSEPEESKMKASVALDSSKKEVPSKDGMDRDKKQIEKDKNPIKLKGENNTVLDNQPNNFKEDIPKSSDSKISIEKINSDKGSNLNSQNFSKTPQNIVSSVKQSFKQLLPNTGDVWSVHYLILGAVIMSLTLFFKKNK